MDNDDRCSSSSRTTTTSPTTTLEENEGGKADKDKRAQSYTYTNYRLLSNRHWKDRSRDMQLSISSRTEPTFTHAHEAN